jgi:hypothetical protein
MININEKNVLVPDNRIAVDVERNEDHVNQYIMNYQMLSVCHCMPSCFRVFYPLFVMEFLIMTYVDHVNQSCFVGRG